MTRPGHRDAIRGLSLGRKVLLTSGGDFWHTREVPGARTSRLLSSDGLHGLRRQPDGGGDTLGIGGSTPVTGEAWMHGAQSQGVGISLEHFAANDQETDRLRVSAVVDMRTDPGTPSCTPRGVCWCARLGW